ncbi:MAG: ABC-ATPase domain-containing protein [Spirochaetota bacterium]
MKTPRELRDTLRRIDSRGYGAYKDIKGVYDFRGPSGGGRGGYVLNIAHVQGDPFAAPSRFIVTVPPGTAGIPAHLYSNRARRTALEDYLLRSFNRAVRRFCSGNRGSGGGGGHPGASMPPGAGGGRGSGKSGAVFSDRTGQEVLQRSASRVDRGEVRLQFSVGLPARGRTVLGRQAEAMIFEEIPAVVEHALVYASLDAAAVERHVNSVEDQETLRGLLDQEGLVAFVADGAILPRRSGVSDLPMEQDRAVAFGSPPELRRELTLPHAGTVSGMGVPRGVTLIVGGGYHGKSTLLRGLERGVYNHVPGDGRESVASHPATVKVRAEDGRRVENVDISPFITNLPGNIDTRRFCSDDASGSTSQAANILEPLELGARCLLVDEDTSATNFMIRDVRMQRLVAKEKEPITPFIDKVGQLYTEHGVSTVLVIGGSGDYFDVADTVVQMDEYRPLVVTEQAREIARLYTTSRLREGGEAFGEIKQRRPAAGSVDARRGRKTRVRARGLRAIELGTETVDLGALEQLVDESQTRAIAEIMQYAAERRRYLDGRRSIREALNLVLEDIRREGLEVLSPFDGESGYYALPRVFEIGGALNRYRRLRVIP